MKATKRLNYQARKKMNTEQRYSMNKKGEFKVEVEQAKSIQT